MELQKLIEEADFYQLSDLQNQVRHFIAQMGQRRKKVEFEEIGGDELVEYFNNGWERIGEYTSNIPTFVCANHGSIVQKSNKCPSCKSRCSDEHFVPIKTIYLVRKVSEKI